jgi:peptide/nickel transport system ATP-binding protein
VNLLAVDGLSVALGKLTAVDRFSLVIGAHETVCLVGESGSGKTVTAMSVMRLIEAKGGRLTEGEIRLEGRNIAALSQRDMTELRGRKIGIVFQDPMTAFDPLFTVGHQIAEVVRRHDGASRREANARAVELLRRVHLAEPELRARQYPHELSGGMRQRAMIAMALACGPRLLIADEPTTALDVTIQAQILMLLRQLQAETGMAILLITHDPGIAAEMADRVAVMYAGRIVEDAPVAEIFARPAHPYTRGLLRSIRGVMGDRRTRLEPIPGQLPPLTELPNGCRFHPRCSTATAACSSAAPALLPHGAGHVACWHPAREPMPVLAAAPARSAAPRVATTALLTATALRKHYVLGHGGRAQLLRAVDGVSLSIAQGETMGLVGESGSGKSTLGRLLLHLEKPDDGQVVFAGQALATLQPDALRRARRDMQMIFQDPMSSLDSRWRIGDIIAEPLVAHERLRAGERRDRARALLEEVGLNPDWADRRPDRLSGGQRQRVAIARAIALRPRFVLADEALSALDASVQAQVVNLLLDLKERLALTYLFIGHGLHMVRRLSDRIGVMYLGRLVEIGPAEEVFRAPAHPYTQALVAAIPEPDPARRQVFRAVAGEIPSAAAAAGCAFAPRCPRARARCLEEAPAVREIALLREAACHEPN